MTTDRPRRFQNALKGANKQSYGRINNITGMKIKMQVLRALVSWRAYAQTQEGERRIVLTLSIMSLVFVADVLGLIIGEVL